jgi:hypothetical protein
MSATQPINITVSPARFISTGRSGGKVWCCSRLSRPECPDEGLGQPVRSNGLETIQLWVSSKKRAATPVTQASTGAAVREKEVRNAALTMQGCGFTTSSSLPHRGWIMKTNHDPGSFMQFHTEFVKKKMPQSGIFYFCINP